jgi:hypothetical protein
MIALSPTAVSFAAWPAMLAALTLATGLFGASALQMVSSGADRIAGESRLKAGVPPVLARTMPTVTRLDLPKAEPPKGPSPETASVRASPAPVTRVVASFQPTLRADAFTSSASLADSGFAPPARMVVLDDVTLHAEPLTRSRALGTLHRGARVEVAARQAGWILVRDGRSLGWVWGEFLASR